MLCEYAMFAAQTRSPSLLSEILAPPPDLASMAAASELWQCCLFSENRVAMRSLLSL